MKARVVVRDASQMRADSPTCGQLMLSLVLAMSACRGSDHGVATSLPFSCRVRNWFGLWF